MNKRIIALIAIVIIVVAAFVALWQLNIFGSSQTIKIGVVAGMQTAEGQDIDRAAQLAIDEINAAGGVYVKDLGKNLKMELVLVDTVDDAAGNTAGPVTRAIKDQGVDILIGGATTGGTLNGQIPAIQNHVPYIITGASLNLVTRRGNLPTDNPLYINDTEGMSYMFHYCTTISDYSTTVAHFLSDSVKPLAAPNRNIRLAVLYRDDGYGRGVKDVTSSIISSDNLPIDVVANVSYATTATSFQSQLLSVKESKPDAVYIAGFIADTSEAIKEGINDVGLKSIYIGVEICEDPQYYSLLGQTGNFQILESKIATQWQGSTWYLPKVGTYVQDYKAKFGGKVPGMLGADTYDAVYIYKNAIELAGTLSKPSIRNAIENTNMPQSLLIMENQRITFSTGANYHEILPRTFIEQLIWDSNTSTLKPYVVYPESIAARAPGISSFKQADFALPPDYQPGSP
ncbi:MAG TPA: ABC transporter substrate-binding protein [Candidatus Sulfotelmatobacter sp.]|nr:ABC transporter substrate-binding protein [Candidatus Sulfotelmatobacter sp.]